MESNWLQLEDWLHHPPYWSTIPVQCGNLFVRNWTLRHWKRSRIVLAAHWILCGTSEYFSVKLKWSYAWFNPGFISCIAVKIFIIYFYYFNCLPFFPHCFLHLRSNQTSFYCCMVSFQSFHCLRIPFFFNFKIAFLFFSHQHFSQLRNYILTFGPSRGTCLMEVSVILLYIISYILSVNISLQRNPRGVPLGGGALPPLKNKFFINWPIFLKFET